MEDEEASPDDRGARRRIAAAIQVATQGGDPQYCLIQRWYFVRRPGSSVYAAIQCLPFDGLKDYVAGQLAIKASQQSRVQDAPSDYGKQRGGPHETFERTELARLDTAATLDDSVPSLYCPAPCIPSQPL